ncbi:polysaccharide deacetylase family protein [Cyclobacterium qasimii]|uniref:Peptidoglycan N-acetylglucosamine deacetylase n=2 Tax=Cyclobacterium qasimii TaxID=1350429 RepID=S7WLB8_9BACT|nr:polysaccharide deacetylase family protein [Cyclobacterium qasimii]EPR65008.1 Peptidoglycan N-acetylglucosamine deacetylase [Cyclobacterium qasimii M12-11B]GEO20878.1 polysaccharide deacetylase [Cyclobacterium qasimii]
MLFYKVPGIIQNLFGSYTWHKDRKQKTVYLTFDDGPVPSVSDYVLRLLEDYNMKATFFMVGDNVSKNPDLANEIAQKGHGIGNHTYHHLKAGKTPLSLYLEDVEQCRKTILEKTGIETKTFRPPYGSINKRYARHLLQEYEIVLWDVISWDFKKGLNSGVALEKVKKYTKNGSIVLFHDQQKSKKNLQEILPKYLDYLSSQGFQTALL